MSPDSQSEQVPGLGFRQGEVTCAGAILLRARCWSRRHHLKYLASQRSTTTIILILRDPAAVLKIMHECGIERSSASPCGLAAGAATMKRHRTPRGIVSPRSHGWTGATFNRLASSPPAERLEQLVSAGAWAQALERPRPNVREDGDLLRADDERLASFDKAGSWVCPSRFHTADPDAFSFHRSIH
jgi:hypothetical protein